MDRSVRSLVGLGVLSVVAALGSPSTAVAAVPRDQTAGDFSVGAASKDWGWFDANVGTVQVYRDFDAGFSYPTWQDTLAYQRHPDAAMNDYSITVLPQRLSDPADPINAKIRRFLATTPKNLTITNFHEPDHKHVANFTPQQFRAGILALAAMVRAQNAIDNGTRQTSVILMNVTFGTWGTSVPLDWWPTDARDGGHVDEISADVYALPHLTNTVGIPSGYTDGLKWRTSQQLLTNLSTFAASQGTPWSISELGFLEDVSSGGHRSAAMVDLVSWAKSHGARYVNYFDSTGSRGDWRLRWSTPTGTATTTSSAAATWKQMVADNTPVVPSRG